MYKNRFNRSEIGLVMKSITIILTLFALIAKAQMHTGARFSSMAYAAVALQDVWSIQQNQAGLCDLKKPVFSLGSTPGFGDHELKIQSAIVALPYRSHFFGLGFQRYGIVEYNEQKMGVTYARRFNTLSAAINVNYHQLYIQNYGSARSFSIEAGLQYWASPNLCLGVHVANPNQSTYNSSVAYIPRRVQIGASYQFSDQLMLATSINKISNNPVDIGVGLEYGLIGWLFLRGGVSVKPLKQYVGFGIHYGQFRFDVATVSHATLGYLPQLAFSYEL